MKLAVSQPYFFPYIGIFQLIHATDFFVVLDNVKYKKRSWMNRNRILHQKKDFNYIYVPVHSSFNSQIKDVKIAKASWKDKILGKISIYAHKAKYYKEVKNLLLKCFKIEEENFCKLSIKYMEIICDYLEIEFKFDFFSKMSLKLPEIKAPDEWSLYISEALGAKTYVNMPKGAIFFNEEKFKMKNIELKFLKPYLREYNQKREKFIPALSIIDVLMWNPKKKVKQMIINDFSFLSKNEIIKSMERDV